MRVNDSCATTEATARVEARFSLTGLEQWFEQKTEEHENEEHNNDDDDDDDDDDNEDLTC